MTLDPERALSAALFARLRAAAIPALGTPPRVYDEPPQSPLCPYVQIGRVDARPWGGLPAIEGAAEGVEHTVTLTCVSRFGGAEEAKAVTAALRDVLHDAPLTLVDHRLVNLRVAYADVFRGSDWRLTYGVVRLRAVTEPLVLEGAA